MTERAYSNREIDVLKETLVAKIDDSDNTNKTAHQKTAETLTRIEGQTTRTNGRVSKLERWQSYVIGFCACIVLIMLPTVLLLIQIFFKLHG